MMIACSICGSDETCEHDTVLIPSAYRQVRLDALLVRGIPAPVTLCKGFLYEGGLHSIAGPPDSGKTTIALTWAVELLRAGRVVLFLDEEGGPEMTTEKLAALGASPDMLARLVYVPFPGRSWSELDVKELTSLAEDTSPAMMLWDSSAAFLARAGLDENSAPDVTSWWSKVLTPIARDLKVAMLVIDHDTKSTESSRYARGSGAKLAAIDVQFKVEIMKPFSRDQDGMLKLLVTKDRRGYLHRNWQVRMGIENGRIQPDFYHQTDTSFADSWTPAKRKIYGALTSEYQTNDEIRTVIAANFGAEKPMTRETASRELNELLNEGYAARRGNETAASWKKARLFVIITHSSRDDHVLDT
jgi:AAA domain-containing protein